MKTILGIAVLALVLPAMAQTNPAPALTLTAEEQSFLKGCGIAQKDIDVIPNLYEDAQQNLKNATAKKSCADLTIVKFKNSRKFVALYYTDPRPEQKPKWDPKKNPWSPDYVTDEESEHIVDMESLFTSRKLSGK